jgi:type I restriction enzyme S subunit
MTGELCSYPEMKPTGLPWLGEVPARWDVRKLRHCGSISGGMTPSMADRSLWDGDVPWVTPKDMKRFTISAASMNVSPKALEATSLRLIPPKSVLLVVRGMILARRVPVARTDQPVTINQDMKAIVPVAGIDAGFLAYRMDAAQEAFVPMIDEAGHGTKRFPPERWKELQLAVPPLDEQRLIVRFLDWHGSQTAKLVRAKQKLIALLNEQKQGIIHRAVTRGLDPNVKLKPSGIPWLGDVPEGWEVKRLKQVSRIRYGLGQPPAEKVGGLPLIRATNVDHGRILAKHLVYVDPDAVPKSRGAFLKTGEIIVVRSGAYTADSAIIPADYEGSVAGYDIVVTATRVLPEFLAAVLLAPHVQIDQLIPASMRAAQPHLNAEELGAAVLAVPDAQSQRRIVAHIDNEAALASKAIDIAQREIALIQEFRTRLIADAVTGKLDVRAAAASLPETTELEAIGDLTEGDDLDEVLDDAENEEVAA